MTPERWQQIEELFHAAADRAPDERTAFLDQACADDPELRREVESLLTQEHRQGTSIETMISDLTESLAATHLEEMIGKKIGPYRVTGIIGEGGMGMVFRAVRDDDEYQKEVAIKLVKRGMDTDFALRRFRHERRRRSRAIRRASLSPKSLQPIRPTIRIFGGRSLKPVSGWAYCLRKQATRPAGKRRCLKDWGWPNRWPSRRAKEKTSFS
ncbi:MAG: hypothetical protein L0229_22030 [Blastocatellia bacterium]|nr:hypothetical protein [Blastocatellia bacterium]